MTYHSRANVTSRLSTSNAGVGSVSSSSSSVSSNNANSEPWTDKCIDFVVKTVRYYRTNDMSHLTPQQIDLITTIRHICIDTYPVDANATKRFESDTSIMNNYKRLQKELGDKPVTSDIFKSSFVYSALPSYAQKFYNKGADHMSSGSVEQAAKHLGYAVQYMVAQAVSNNTPIPFPFEQQLANDYLTLLLQRATIPQNIQDIINNNSGGGKLYGNSRVLLINQLVNNVIDDLFAGGSDYYLYMLNETNRSRILSMKENISYMAPLSATTDIFKFIATLATNSGKKPSVFQSASILTMPSRAPVVSEEKNKCQQQLTELAFENEALRRFILQQLNYKNDIPQQ
ncbi:GP41 [Alphabaculovirus myunipunctae]|uniref:GP41 n=1 Tax=Mythimna unipuncta nucleopolyhedrovirus TaxID=447897 RepID=A0A2K9VSB0_9ABAC|nr:GP41 [Mythimna unipuncta nucleopolyhedrovirus]AUV65359.1 GP41 [Mythimna unipuncta nucleopolyhedrovirus]